MDSVSPNFLWFEIHQLLTLNRSSFPNNVLDATGHRGFRHELRLLARSIGPILPLPPPEQRSLPVSVQHQLLHPRIASLRSVIASAALHQRRRQSSRDGPCLRVSVRWQVVVRAVLEWEEESVRAHKGKPPPRSGPPRSRSEDPTSSAKGVQVRISSSDMGNA